MSPQYLIKGDLSGIQKFIFNVLSDGAARSIRGRSFFLKIVLEVAMKSIFDAMNIKDKGEIENAKVSTSGGNFILKVNANPKKVIEEIETKFMEAFRYVDINLIISYSELNETDYPASIDDLDSNSRIKKYNLIGKESLDFFEPFIHENIKVNKNNKWSDLAAAIINENFNSWNVRPNENAGVLAINGQKLLFAGYEVQFSKDGEYKLHNYIESYNPRDSKSKNLYKKFEDFARWDGEGIQKLGILAMDVDGLGAYFNHIKSVSEHKRFDKELYTFFNVYLRELIEKEKDFDQKVYPVTAGGDDSYFVGQWSIMLKLAKRIKSSFLKQFADKGLTISAALIIVKPKFPVIRFVDLVDDEIKKAKYNYPMSKGNISIFSEVIKWEFLEREIEDLRKEFRRGITAGLLAKARLTSKDIADDEGMKLSDYWKMDYYLRDFALNDKAKYDKISKTFRENLNSSTKELEKLKQNINKDEVKIKAKNYRLIFPIAARLAELDNRKNR